MARSLKKALWQRFKIAISQPVTTLAGFKMLYGSKNLSIRFLTSVSEFNLYINNLPTSNARRELILLVPQSSDRQSLILDSLAISRALKALQDSGTEVSDKKVGFFIRAHRDLRIYIIAMIRLIQKLDNNKELSIYYNRLHVSTLNTKVVTPLISREAIRLLIPFPENV